MVNESNLKEDKMLRVWTETIVASLSLRSGRKVKLKQIEMEVLFAKDIVRPSYANFPMICHSTNCVPEQFHSASFISRRVNRQIDCSRIVLLSKRSAFQDFQGYAKPSRLLPATEGNAQSNDVSEDIFSSVELDNSNSFYMIELRTSKDFSSSLKDLNAGILLCLIDVDGDSILQRISAASYGHPSQGNATDLSDSIHFQRGAIDIVTFKGSKLGKIDALWIGLESGSWRLDGVRLTVIYGPLSLQKYVEMQEHQFDGLQYEFEADNILLGEGGVSVAELRPTLVTEFSRDNLSVLLNWSSLPASLVTPKISNEESMREYADLKFSLLLYDLILILTGSTILIFLSEKAAYSFLVGGISGFLYLLLLQRSVDGLSAPSSPSADGWLGNFVQAFRGFKGPLLSLALALVTSAVALKCGIGGSSVALTPTDLFVGIAGFLACKVSVVLAAFRPIKRSLEENI